MLQELYTELQRTTLNVGCRIHDKRDAPARVEVRRGLASLRSRARTHARAAYGLNLATPAAPKPAPERADAREPPPASVEELRARCPTYAATSSCEHLCERLCYFWAYEPERRLHTLRWRAFEHPLRPSVQAWTAWLAVDKRPPFARVVFRDGSTAVEYDSVEAAWEAILAAALAGPLGPPARAEGQALCLPWSASGPEGSTAPAQAPRGRPISPFGLVEKS